MRYIACDGQITMARIGYSPLPPNLSQEMANSIGRMNGVAPEALDAGNCANPRFRGSLGAGAQSPVDPYLGLAGFSGNPDPGDAAAAEAGGAGAGDEGGGRRRRRSPPAVRRSVPTAPAPARPAPGRRPTRPRPVRPTRPRWPRVAAEPAPRPPAADR